MVDWKIRKLNDKDDLLNWRKLIARREKSTQYLTWEYLNGSCGPVETWLAVDGEKIVGQYSAQRYDAFYFGEKVIGSLAFDAGTHPDYRRRGIFVALGKKLFSEEGRNNVPFSNGFPNELAVPGHRKVSWNFLCPLPLHKIALNSIKLKGTNKFEFANIDKFDKEFDGFSESFKDDIPIYLNRTKEHLNWRFVEKPNLKDINYNYSKYKIYDKTGELVGYIVTKKYNHQLQLVDFLLPDNEDLYRDILYTLLCLGRFLILQHISLYINPNNSFALFLKKEGFRFIDTNRVYIVRANNDYLDKELLFNEKNHYITMGDCDVF